MTDYLREIGPELLGYLAVWLLLALVVGALWAFAGWRSRRLRNAPPEVTPRPLRGGSQHLGRRPDVELVVDDLEEALDRVDTYLEHVGRSPLTPWQRRTLRAIYAQHRKP